MDNDQLVKRVEWLDEERRSDRSTISELQKRIAKLEGTLTRGGVLGYERRSNDVRRHQVRRELNAREVEIDRLGERPDQVGLTETGNAFEQNVAAGEERGQYAVDDLGVSDNCLGDLGA